MRPHNATVSPILLRVIHETVERDGLSQGNLTQRVLELSRRFTTKRDSLTHTYLDDPQCAAAYLQYFLPVNLAKVQTLLNEMPTPEVGQRFSVLDIGSGPGTGALAVLDWWYQQEPSYTLSVTAVDASMMSLRQAEQVWERYCQAADIRNASFGKYEEDLEKRVWMEPIRPKGPFDLVILANCLNEIHAGETDPIDARTGLVKDCLSMLAVHGTMIIVEPALRETSRSLHHVRDRLLQEKHCTIYSPCLHEGSCPALVKPDDWCHEERAWQPPMSIQEIDRAVGFIKDALKFSYLLLRKDGKTIVGRQSHIYRVVSELRELKGEKRAWLCNEQGRQEVGRQDRLASPQNEAFDQWHRGAIVQIEEIVHKERRGKVSALGRIERDAKVQFIRSV